MFLWNETTISFLNSLVYAICLCLTNKEVSNRDSDKGKRELVNLFEEIRLRKDTRECLQRVEFINISKLKIRNRINCIN